MTSITYIGMDVHTTNFTLCCYSFEDDRVYATVQVKPEYTQIIKYINRIRKQHGEDTRFVCGYEAGCLAEVGDFNRFRSAPQFAAYLGLVPGEDSSSDRQHRTGITKAGNKHLRRLLIESAHC